MANANVEVLLAEDDQEMILILSEFLEYVKEKHLCLNVEKTKLIRFRKWKNDRGDRMGKDWKR